MKLENLEALLASLGRIDPIIERTNARRTGNPDPAWADFYECEIERLDLLKCRVIEGYLGSSSVDTDSTASIKETIDPVLLKALVEQYQETYSCDDESARKAVLRYYRILLSDVSDEIKNLTRKVWNARLLSRTYGFSMGRTLRAEGEQK